MSDEVALKVVNLLMVFLIGTSFGWLIYGKNTESINFGGVIKILKINKLMKIAFYIFWGLFVCKLGLVLVNVRTYGYLALFNGTIATVKMPIIFSGAATITEVLCIILLYYNRDRKSFIRYAGLLLFAGLVKMLTGQRGYALVLLLYFIYLYSRNFTEIKITNWRIILVGLTVPFVVQMIYNQRYGLGNSLTELLTNNIYVQVLESIGGSIECIGNTIIYNDRFSNKVPFLIGYFVDFFKSEPLGQVIEDITDGNYLGDHLTYMVNKKSFFAGHGLGTSIVAEAYSSFDENLVLVFVFAVIVCIVVHYIAKKAYSNICFSAISFYLLTDFIYSPRDSIFKSLKNTLFAVMVCIVIQFFQRTRGDNINCVMGETNSIEGDK